MKAVSGKSKGGHKCADPEEAIMRSASGKKVKGKKAKPSSGHKY